MMTLSDYKSALFSSGPTLGDIRKDEADFMMNQTFTLDVGYKRVYVLTKLNGWQYVDAKYSKHTTPSILRDNVDYYLQFRPGVHFPVGTYIFIPDDTSEKVGFSIDDPIDPMDLSDFDISKLWFIVGRDNARQFVRYNILQCNFNFKWIAKQNGKKVIFNALGAVRVQNSYTSGVWTDCTIIHIIICILCTVHHIGKLYGEFLLTAGNPLYQLATTQG